MGVCETCNGPLEESEEKVCGNCNEETKLSQNAGATRCLCEEGPVTKKSMMQCVGCARWWHPACVGLEGLSKYSSDSIKDWNCPLCFRLSDNIREKLEGEDFVGDNDVKGEVKREVAAVIPEIMKRVEETFRAEFNSFKTESKGVVERSFADVVRGEQKTLIEDAVQHSSQNAVRQSLQLIDSNLTEQRNRSNNVVISNAPESPNENLTDCVYNIMEPVAQSEIPRSDIVKAVRLGKPEPGKNRLILVTLRHEEDARFLHNYKYGRKVLSRDQSQKWWINADLTRIERDAAYQQRQLRKQRREANELRRAQEEQAPVAEPDLAVPHPGGPQNPQLEADASLQAEDPARRPNTRRSSTASNS